MKQKKKRQLYPGVKQAEEQKGKRTIQQSDIPLMFGTIPNYDAFPGWDCEKVLVFLNID